MDIIVQNLDIVIIVVPALLIAQNVHMKFQKMEHIMNSSVLNVKVMNTF